MSLLQYTRLIIATGLLSVGLSSQAAVVHIVDNGQLIGATGVEVDGALYDVAFTDGTFDSLYPSGIPTFHANGADAILFSQALLDSVFIDLGAPSNAFDSLPTLTAGCDDILFCQILTPYEDNGTFVRVRSVFNSSFNNIDFAGNTFVLNKTDDMTNFETEVWAVFTPSSAVAAVPEPSTYAMLAAGLLMLAGFSRRSNRV